MELLWKRLMPDYYYLYLCNSSGIDITRHRRFFGKGLLVKPCPECGSRVTFAEVVSGDQPVTLDLKLMSKAA
jgi:hypothetical protein